MNLPLAPDQVRALCARLHFTAAPALNETQVYAARIDKDATLSPEAAKIPYHKRVIKPCVCGAPGFHQFGTDWECERCYRLRVERERCYNRPRGASAVIRKERAMMRKSWWITHDSKNNT